MQIHAEYFQSYYMKSTVKQLRQTMAKQWRPLIGWFSCSPNRSLPYKNIYLCQELKTISLVKADYI